MEYLIHFVLYELVDPTLMLYIYIGYTLIWRDSCYLDPEGKTKGMQNSMNPDKL